MESARPPVCLKGGVRKDGSSGDSKAPVRSPLSRVFEVLPLESFTEAMQGEGVGPYTCSGILHEIGPRVQLSDGRIRQYFVVQVGMDLLLMEAYDEVGEAVRKIGVGAMVQVEFVIRGWRWYPPEREAKYLLRLTALSIQGA